MTSDPASNLEVIFDPSISFNDYESLLIFFPNVFHYFSFTDMSTSFLAQATTLGLYSALSDSQHPVLSSYIATPIHLDWVYDFYRKLETDIDF